MLPKIPKPNGLRQSVSQTVQSSLVGQIVGSVHSLFGHNEQPSRTAEPSVSNNGTVGQLSQTVHKNYKREATSEIVDNLVGQPEFEQVCHAVSNGHSVLVLGEYGSGINGFADALLGEMAEEFNCAIASYKGSLKKFLVQMAEALDIPTSEPK